MGGSVRGMGGQVKGMVAKLEEWLAQLWLRWRDEWRSKSDLLLISRDHGGQVRGMGGSIKGMGGESKGWVTKLIKCLLATAANWVRIQTSLKIHKWTT